MQRMRWSIESASPWGMGDDIDLVPAFEAYRRNVDASSSPRGPPKLHTYPKLAGIDSQLVDRGEQQMRVYRWRDGLSQTRLYPIIKEESVEILVTPRTSGFSHVSMRIGRQFYSFDNIGSTSIRNFTSASSSTYGLVYKLDPEQIKELESAIEIYYRSASQYNIPPFDSYGGRLEVIEKDGKFYYKHDEGETPNRLQIKAELVEEDGYVLKGR